MSIRLSLREAENAHLSIVTRDVWEKANIHANGQNPRPRMKLRYESPYLLAGLLRCDRCGFGSQGWTGRAHGRWYPRYIDSGWKNKRQCEYLALDKEALESFAIQAVTEIVSDPTVSRRVEHFLNILLDAEPDHARIEIKCLEEEKRSSTHVDRTFLPRLSERLTTNRLIR